MVSLFLRQLTGCDEARVNVLALRNLALNAGDLLSEGKGVGIACE